MIDSHPGQQAVLSRDMDLVINALAGSGKTATLLEYAKTRLKDSKILNSLQQVNVPVFNLSQSFRFDHEIALVANKLLAWKQHVGLPPGVIIVGAGKSDAVVQSKATTGRTNVSLL